MANFEFISDESNIPVSQYEGIDIINNTPRNPADFADMQNMLRHRQVFLTKDFFGNTIINTSRNPFTVNEVEGKVQLNGTLYVDGYRVKLIDARSEETVGEGSAFDVYCELRFAEKTSLDTPNILTLKDPVTQRIIPTSTRYVLENRIRLTTVDGAAPEDPEGEDYASYKFGTLTKADNIWTIEASGNFNIITQDISTLMDPDFAGSEHTHDIDDITNLTSALAGKSDTVHGHAISDVTDLSSTLSGKANTAHTHSVTDITDLVESDSLIAGFAFIPTTGNTSGSPSSVNQWMAEDFDQVYNTSVNDFRGTPLFFANSPVGDDVTKYGVEGIVTKYPNETYFNQFFCANSEGFDDRLWYTLIKVPSTGMYEITIDTGIHCANDTDVNDIVGIFRCELEENTITSEEPLTYTSDTIAYGSGAFAANNVQGNGSVWLSRAGFRIQMNAILTADESMNKRRYRLRVRWPQQFDIENTWVLKHSVFIKKLFSLS